MEIAVTLKDAFDVACLKTGACTVKQDQFIRHFSVIKLVHFLPDSSQC